MNPPRSTDRNSASSVNGIRRIPAGFKSLTGLASLAVFVASLSATPADAQSASGNRAAQVRGDYVIAMVLPRDEQDIEAGFRDYLRKRNIPVRYVSIRYSGNPNDAADLIEQVRKAKPDLIYSWGTPTTLALAGTYENLASDAASDAASGAAGGAAGGPASGPAIRDIPIVFAEVTDPVGTRLLPSLAQPGRNVTGVSHVAPLAVQLRTMQAYRPVAKIGYITNPAESNTRLVRAALGQLAQTAKFAIVDEVVPLDAAGKPDAAQLPAMIRRIAAEKVDFLYVPPSTFLALTHRDLVTQAALAAGLPTFCSTESIVRRASCLFGLFSSGANIGRFAAYKATQILVERTPASQIPAESLQAFSLLINMRIARALELYPPLSLLNVSEVLPVETALATSP